MMRYAVIILLIVLSIHPFSFAQYCWIKQNRLAAVGTGLLTVVSVIYPSILLFLSKS